MVDLRYNYWYKDIIMKVQNNKTNLTETTHLYNFLFWIKKQNSQSDEILKIIFYFTSPKMLIKPILKIFTIDS